MNTLRKAQIGWISYDFANTIFSMNIVTFFFSPWVVLTLGVEDIYYSIAYSASMILVAVTMPGLGRRADQIGGKLSGLKVFTYLCVLFTVILSVVAILQLDLFITAILVLIFFAFANYFYEGGLTYYNSLLADVSNKSNIGKISGFGVAVGYLGAICGLLMVKPITDGWLIPGISGREYAFLPTALLFLLFALPTFMWVKEKRAAVTVTPTQTESFLKRLKTALKETRDYPGVLRFLISDYLIEDAIATTVLFMAIYAEAVVGFDDDDKIILFLSSTSFALVGSFLFGYLTDKIKAKPALLIAIFGWVVVLLGGVFISSKTEFYILGAFVGIFLGAVWTTSRPLLNTLVPEEKLGQFYGLYTLSGRAAATIGPLLWGVVVLISKSDRPLGGFFMNLFGSLGFEITEQFAASIHYRVALLSLLLSMIAGLICFFKVPNRRCYELEK